MKEHLTCFESITQLAGQCSSLISEFRFCECVCLCFGIVSYGEMMERVGHGLPLFLFQYFREGYQHAASTQFKVCLNCQSMVHLVTNGCWQRSQSVLEKLQFYLPLVQQYGQGISRISTTSNRIIHWKFEQLYDLDCVNQLMCRSNCVLSSYTAHSKTFTNRKKLALQQILFRVPAAHYCFWLSLLFLASTLCSLLCQLSDLQHEPD